MKSMKRLLLLFVIFIIPLSLLGCGAPTDESNSSISSSVSGGSESNALPPDTSLDIDISSSKNMGSETTSDDRGIPGMRAFPIRAILESDPFCVPMTDDVPAPAEAESIYSSSCTSSGSGNKGILYDYSITMDSDGEIIGASFGIVGTTASQKELLTAADLFFYSVSIISYDTSDEEQLTAWFEENLPSASDAATEIVVGDAKFELYGIPETMYWVDISKVSE